MGLIKVVSTSLSSTSENDWLDYIYCDCMKDNILIKKGLFKSSESNIGINNNIIKNGSKIIVREDQFLIIECDGKIIDFTAEAGYYTFDQNIEPSMLCGEFGEELLESFDKFKMKDVVYDNLRAYYINTKYIKGNKFKTKNSIPFTDSKFGITINIKCYGEYILRVVDPLLFYNTFGNNIEEDYVINDNFKNSFLADFLQVLQPALTIVSQQKISYNMLPSRTNEVSDAVRKYLKNTWGTLGINVVRVSIASVTPTNESVEMIKKELMDFTSEFTEIETLDKENSWLETNSSNQVQKQSEINSVNFVKDENDIQKINDRGIQCPNCGSLIIENFCTECGTKKPDNIDKKICPNCGSELDTDTKFCVNCGKAL